MLDTHQRDGQQVRLGPRIALGMLLGVLAGNAVAVLSVLLMDDHASTLVWVSHIGGGTVAGLGFGGFVGAMTVPRDWDG